MDDSIGNRAEPKPSGQKHRSVGEMLRKARTTPGKRKVALDWAANWKYEQTTILGRLKRALETGERGFLDRAIAELEAVTNKKLDALPRVIELLLDGVEDEAWEPDGK